MKKALGIIAILFLSIITIFFEYGYKNNIEPDTYYRVYLDDQILGTISSSKELDNYFTEKGKEIKEKVITYKKELENDNIDETKKEELESYINRYENYYHASNYNYPSGLEIKKVSTYVADLDNINDVYKKITSLRNMTIEGYQITIKKENSDDIIIYVTDVSIFFEAVNKTIEAYVGVDEYNDYLNNNQQKITTIGTYLENIYVDEDITIKKKDIPDNKKIYSDSDELSKYLLFRTSKINKTYQVKLGDTIESVSTKNLINTEEFLISNPEYTSANNLLTPGQIIKIGEVNPLISVVIEKTIIEDVANKFNTEYKNDSSIAIGNDVIIQKGIDGVDRVESIVKEINGVVTYAEQYNKEELSQSTTEIIAVGTKYVPSVGSLKSWGWPTARGWFITDTYRARYNPVTGRREFHSGLDIAGAGNYGSPIYATNNGTIHTAGWNNSYGWYIIINHNNGYYSLYAHMSKLLVTKVGNVVARGEQIGKMGATGTATGPHLHFEIHRGLWSRVNPYGYLLKK